MEIDEFGAEEDINKLSLRAKKKLAENKRYFRRLKSKKAKEVNFTVAEIHEEVFANTDCLKCGNCCKTTSPLFTQKDITRISKYLKLRPADFCEKYLRLDEDDDYVLQQVPCTFLGADNYCSIYDVKPKACREYPHTNAANFDKLFNITVNNTAICPAVYNIVEKLKQVVTT